MSAIFIEDEIVHYEVLGRGRPVIFLHGWVGSWRYWLSTMQAASTVYRAYAIDLWGFGDSAKAEGRYTLEGQVALLDGFLEQMGIMRAALVGHGLGAVVGLHYALRNPGMVDRILAVGYPLAASLLNTRLHSETPLAQVATLLERTEFTDPVWVDVPKVDPRAPQTCLKDLNKAELQDVCKQLETACLMVYGQNDPAVQTPDLGQLDALPESSHSIVLESSGHFPMLEESSKFNRLLLDFLGLSSGESPRQLQLKEQWKRRVR